MSRGKDLVVDLFGVRIRYANNWIYLDRFESPKNDRERCVLDMARSSRRWYNKVEFEAVVESLEKLGYKESLRTALQSGQGFGVTDIDIESDPLRYTYGYSGVVREYARCLIG